MQAGILCRLEYCTGWNTVQAGVLHRLEYCAGWSTTQAGILCRLEYCAGRNTAQAEVLHRPRYCTDQEYCHEAGRAGDKWDWMWQSCHLTTARSGERLNALPSGLCPTIHAEKCVDSLLRMGRAQTINAEPFSVRSPHKFMQVAPRRVGLAWIQVRATTFANCAWNWNTTQSDVQCFVTLMGWVKLATVEATLATSTTAFLVVAAGPISPTTTNAALAAAGGTLVSLWLNPTILTSTSSAQRLGKGGCVWRTW